MKEDFDDILKRKWAEQHFTMDNHHREQMMALLDEKKRRRFFPLWWVGAFLLIGGVTAYIMWWNPSSNGGDTLHQDESSLALPQNETSGLMRDIKTNVTSDANEKDQAQSLLSQGAKSIPAVTADNLRSVNDKQNHTLNQSSELSIPANSPNSINAKSSSEPDHIKVNGLIPKAKTPDQTSVMLEHRSDIILHSDHEKQIIPEKQVGAETPIADNDTDYVPIIPTPEVRRAYDLLPITGLEMSGIDMASVQAPTTPEAVLKAKRGLFVFGETGAGLVLPSQPDFDAGLKWRAGAGIGYKISPSFQLSSSLGYILQAGGFDFQRSSAVDFAGFGARSSFNTLTPDKLHYVYTRLGAQYRIQRHLIGVHGGFQYLYGAQGHLVTQVQDQFVSGIYETSDYAWLVTDGLRRWNWTADLYYGYQIAPRWSVMAGADFYFSSITIDDPGLSKEGYYWRGAYAPIHPFITLNYMIYAGR